jgi:hypothetical protein
MRSLGQTWQTLVSRHYLAQPSARLPARASKATAAGEPAAAKEETQEDAMRLGRLTGYRHDPPMQGIGIAG